MNKISEKQFYYLLWLTIMNQSQKSLQVLKNTLCLMERLESSIEKLDFDIISKAMNLYPKLHRFPNKMAKDIWNSIELINNHFKGDIHNVFNGTDEDILNNLLLFRGIREHKAKICIFVLQ